MSIRVSFRRSLGLAGIVLGCLLAFVLLQGQAEGKPQPDCAKGSEQAGCKLPVGADYRAQVKTGSASGMVTAVVISRGISVGVNAYIDCKKFDPSNGDMSGIFTSFSGNQRPKVGGTYKIKQSDSESGEEGGSSTSDSELILDYKSAKQLVLTLHMVTTVEGKLQCDGSKTWTLKRT